MARGALHRSLASAVPAHRLARVGLGAASTRPDDEHAALLASHARLGACSRWISADGARARFRALLLAPDNLDAETRRRLIAAAGARRSRTTPASCPRLPARRMRHSRRGPLEVCEPDPIRRRIVPCPAAGLRRASTLPEAPRMFRPLEVFIGLRYTRAKRRNHFISFISLVSILGIAVGVTALITVISVMNGFDKELKDRILGMVAHATDLGRRRDRAATGRRRSRSPTANPHVLGAAPYVEREAMLQGRAPAARSSAA